MTSFRSNSCHAVRLLAVSLIVPFLSGSICQGAAQEEAPPSRSEGAAVPKSINFVSYNLKNYLPMSRRVDGENVPDAPKPEAEITKLIEIIAATKPDILGICEIGRNDDVIDFQTRLTKAGVTLKHLEFTGGGDTTRRLALLSRFPIVATDSQTELTYKIGKLTLPFQRGILDATVEVHPQYRVRFLGVHLKSKRETPTADQSLMRRNEARLLRKHTDAILKESPEINLMVYGDFNDTRNETAVREIVGRFGTSGYLTPLRLTDEDDESWTHYWSYADIYSRIDFSCASKGLLPEVDRDACHIFTSPGWFEASDHRPLVVKILPVERD